MATQSASSVSSLAFGTFGTLTAGGSQTPSSVSSSSVPPPGTLTTIFTPPADCFSAPETWQPCGIQDGETRCYWSQAYTCYPAEGHPISSIVWGLESSLFPAIYRYSPGVLPSGYTTQTVYSGAVGGGTESVAVGCPSGWSSIFFCTSTVTASWLSGSKPTSGVFIGLLPQIAVSWESSDLSLFTPASAPVLPSESLEKYESSVAASRSRATATPKQTAPPSSSQSSTSSPSPSSGGGLSTGAKAGIGVGVAGGVLLLLGLAIWFWRRHRRQGKEYKSPDGYEGMRHSRGAAELPNNPMKPKELSAEHELKQVGGGRNAPPVPVASKPRFHTELE